MKTATQTAANRHEVFVDGAKIFVYEQGEGSPVMFLHGSPDSHEMWLPVLEYLPAEMRFIAPDLPGFGKSTLPDEFSLSLDHMADFIRDLLLALEVHEPVTLVTSDFGGHYGVACMVKYPDLVRGIAISNTNFFPDYDWHFFAKMYRMPILGELLLATGSRAILAKTLKGVAPALPDSYIESSYDSGFGSSYVRKTILRMYRERASKDFSAWEEQLLRVLAEKPAIVLWGDKDPFITPDYAERWGKAEVHHFRDYSHWLPLEATADYAKTLRSWMATL